LEGFWRNYYGPWKLLFLLGLKKFQQIFKGLLFFPKKTWEELFGRAFGLIGWEKP